MSSILLRYYKAGATVVCIDDNWTTSDGKPLDCAPKVGDIMAIIGRLGEHIRVVPDRMIYFHYSHFAPINVTLSDGALPICEPQSILNLDAP